MPTVSTIPTAAHYNRLRAGAVEYSTDNKPTNADAITARHLAIREGRLTVVARGTRGSEGDVVGHTADAPEFTDDCLGCESETPVFTSASGASTTANNYIPPTRFAILGTKSGVPDLLLTLERIDTVGYPGSCAVVDSVCGEETPCSFDVTLTFGASIQSNAGDLPNITFTDPFAFVPGTTVEVTPSNVQQIGNTITCEYSVVFPEANSDDAMACGQSWTKIIDPDDLALTASGWTFADDALAPSEITVRLACKPCGDDSDPDPPGAV